MAKNSYLPFYMAYFGSIPGVGAEEIRTYEDGGEMRNPMAAELNLIQKEEALMQSYYPAEMQVLQGIVEQICNQEDYAGSAIYDEYPDKGMLERMVDRIVAVAGDELPGLYEEAMDMDDWTREPGLDSRFPSDDREMQRMQWDRDDRDDFRRRRRRDRRRNPLRDLSQILLFNELRRRRCRNGRCRVF